MATSLFYIMPLLLGRTFDLDKMQVGVDIYPQTLVSKPEIIQNPVTETRYKIVDNTEEVREMLDVGGSIALNVKSGVVKGGVAGSYLTDAINRENTVEILVKATYQTETHALAANAVPFKTWKSMSGLGTHYVKSVTYGGELIASVRLICKSSRDKKDIKGALEAGGQMEGIDLGFEVEGGYLSDISKSVESMQIKVHSSIPLSKIPHDIKELEAMLDRFPEDMKAHNEGKGVPIRMELWPLDSLDSSRPKYIQNRILEAYLDVFEQKFDDLLNTKAAISDWMSTVVQPLTDDQEKQVGQFNDEVMKVLRNFYEVIGNLDMTAGTGQLDAASKAYGQGLPGHFYNRYRRLRESIVHDQGEWSRIKGSGAIFTHWGTRNCSKGSETITTGYGAGPGDFGGGSNFLCLESVPITPATSKKYYSVSLAAITYEDKGRTFSLSCCTCRMSSKGAARTFAGMTSCPKDWSLVYSGTLLGGGTQLKDTDFVCLDSKADSYEAKSSKFSLIKSQFFSGKQNENYPCVVCMH